MQPCLAGLKSWVWSLAIKKWGRESFATHLQLILLLFLDRASYSPDWLLARSGPVLVSFKGQSAWEESQLKDYLDHCWPGAMSWLLIYGWCRPWAGFPELGKNAKLAEHKQQQVAQLVCFSLLLPVAVMLLAAWVPDLSSSPWWIVTWNC